MALDMLGMQLLGLFLSPAIMTCGTWSIRVTLRLFRDPPSGSWNGENDTSW